jgi:hypothetical protein
MNTSISGRTSSGPKINGSQSGFIALVVSLSIFVVICCIAIFWLLKYHEPSHEDRLRRKAELDAARTDQSQIQFNPRSLGERISRAFGRSGWVRAHDGEDDEGEANVEWRGQESRILDRNSFESPTSPHNHPPQHTEATQHNRWNANEFTPPSSTSDVELSAHSPPTAVKSEHVSYPERTKDVSHPEPSILSHMPSYETRQSEFVRMHSMSAEIVVHDYEQFHNEREFSVQSSDSHFGTAQMQKWENGTKFKENIR